MVIRSEPKKTKKFTTEARAASFMGRGLMITDRGNESPVKPCNILYLNGENEEKQQLKVGEKKAKARKKG